MVLMEKKIKDIMSIHVSEIIKMRDLRDNNGIAMTSRTVISMMREKV